MKLVTSFVSFVCICALALTACGSSSSSSSSDELASLAPAGTPVYFEFTAQPSDEQQATIQSLIARFAPEAAGSDFDQTVQQLLDQQLAKDKSGYKISYADDIQPWLGAKGSFWIPSVPQDYDQESDSGNTPAAFVVQTSDDAAAQAFIDKAIESSGIDVEKKEIDGIQTEADPDGQGALGIDDGYLIVASTDDAFSTAVDARNGDSLADEDGFDSSFSEVSGDTFASAYIDPKPFAQNNSDIDPQDLDAVEQLYPGLLDTPIAASLSATSDSISLDVSGAAPPGYPSSDPERVTDAPAKAVAAIGLGDLGQQISASLDQVKSLAEQQGATNFDPDQIDQLLESQTGISLQDIEDTLGKADIYVSGEFPADYAVGLQIGLKKDPSTVFGALRSAIEKAPTEQGARFGPSLSGGNGLSVQLPAQHDPANPRYFDFSYTSDEATLLISPSKTAIAEAGSGSISDSPLFQDATAALGDGLSPVFFADLGKIGDAVLASGTSLDPDGQRFFDFLQKQATYFVAGTGDDGSTARFTLGLKPQPGAGQ